MALDVQKAFSDILAQYQDKRESFNCLLLGDAGAGKTFSLRTARKPVVVYQFDPGGAVCLSGEEGIYILDYSDEDPSDPTAFRRWEKDFFEHKKSGLFDHVATLALDSITTWGDALMNAILKANGRAPRAGGVQLTHSSGNVVAIPELRDYQIQMSTMSKYIGALTGIAPDFICIGHIARDKDEVSGRMVSGPMVTGKLSQKLPLLFDEIYIAEANAKPSSGTEYVFLTQPSGIHKPRSRMSGQGKLDAKEKPDFKHILKKCGRDTSDLQ